MTELVIEGYLTQKKLEHVLSQACGDRWLGRELKVPGTRRRWDMACQSDSGIVVVEYAGDEHYRNALKVKVDGEKDAVARELGYRVVRFPYWVQLDSVTARHFLDMPLDVRSDFPHGFISTKLFPASFCEKGVKRFAMELESLPGTVRGSVVASLKDRAAEHGVDFVVPTSIRHLVV